MNCRYLYILIACQKIDYLIVVRQYHIQQEGPVYDFRKPDTPPILLILDRRNDPVTPLLSQWTYQALVHNMIGIQNGRVDLSYVPDIRPEMKVAHHFHYNDCT